MERAADSIPLGILTPVLLPSALPVCTYCIEMLSSRLHGRNRRLSY